uniref:Uncharacterized protein n=1 Tax=Rhizophora mucronata TaxID=61149 RepID=A0A2P2NAL5_RHIMU
MFVLNTCKFPMRPTCYPKEATQFTSLTLN